MKKEHILRHISKQGNALLRYLLVEAAHQLVRRARDEELRRFYFRLLTRKNSAVAITAVVRKLALRLYRMTGWAARLSLSREESQIMLMSLGARIDG